jgi:uncharacterized protein
MPQMSYVMAQTVAVDEQQMPKEPGAVNGGKVVTPKTPIPGMGAYARLADTEGNVIGLFEIG